MSYVPASLAFQKSALHENRAVVSDDDDARRLINTGEVLPCHDVTIVDPRTRRRSDDGRVGETMSAAAGCFQELL